MMGRIVGVGETTIADAINVEQEAVVGEERGMKYLYVFGIWIYGWIYGWVWIWIWIWN